jgi:hypothetical protein
MMLRRSITVLLLLALTGIVGSRGIAGTDDAPPPKGKPANPPEGVEILTRGPVHEAYAQPLVEQVKNPPIVPQKPPEPINEEIPEQKLDGENVEWIPGYWAWDDEPKKYIWVTGLWRVPPPDRQWVPGYWAEAEGGWQRCPGYWMTLADTEDREVTFLPEPPAPPEEKPGPAPNPDSVYVPGNWTYVNNNYTWQPGNWVANTAGWIFNAPSYSWTPRGYTFVNGYWDYPLGRRGLLFAPVAVRPNYVTRVNYVPRHVIPHDTILDAFFVRPGWRQYVFGDYFDPRYRNHFVPWFNYRVNPFVRDSLYSFNHWLHRKDERWEHDLRDRFDKRLRGELPRPPRTLPVGGNRLPPRFPDLVRPLAGYRRPGVAVKPLSKEQREREASLARPLRDIGPRRHDLERPNRKGVARLHVPRPHAVVHGNGRVKPPPYPNRRPNRAVADRHDNQRRAAPKDKPHVADLRPGARPANRPAAGKPVAKANPKPQPKPQPKPKPKPKSQPRPVAKKGGGKAHPNVAHKPKQAHKPAAKPHAKPKAGAHKPPPKAHPHHGAKKPQHAKSHHAKAKPAKAKQHAKAKPKPKPKHHSSGKHKKH